MVSLSLAFFSGGSNSYCFLCAAASVDFIWAFCSGERDSRCFLCSAVLFLILELSDQVRVSCNICVVQQYDSFQIGLYLQVKETLVSFHVYQHWFLKFWPFAQEEGTRIVSCVHQHHCIIFVFFLWWERLLIVLLFSSIYDQTLCFCIGRERLSISSHCCRICFQILFEEIFSMLFNLSGCSSAENPCNLHKIIATFFIFLHEYLVFVLRPSSFIYIINGKTSRCNIFWSKKNQA